MINHTVETAPFLYNYKIWDTQTEEYVYTCTHRGDVYEAHRNYFHEWIYKEVYWPRSRSYFYDSARPNYRSERDYRRYSIINHFGELVPYDELHKIYGKPSRYEGFTNRTYHDKKPDVRYKKGNPNKIKRGYHNGSWWDDDYPTYENQFVTGGWYRHFRTTAERRQNYSDVREYGQEIVRGARRGHNLPNTWDDECNATCRSLDSWKTHSKRRKQWKPKP